MMDAWILHGKISEVGNKRFPERNVMKFDLSCESLVDSAGRVSAELEKLKEIYSQFCNDECWFRDNDISLCIVTKHRTEKSTVSIGFDIEAAPKMFNTTSFEDVLVTVKANKSNFVMFKLKYSDIINKYCTEAQYDLI
jgi:hypothetical protein